MVEQILREIQQQGWSKQKNPLPEHDLAQIRYYLEDHKKEFKPAKVGQASGRVRKEEVRGDFTFWLDTQEPDPAVAPMIHFLSELKDAFNRSFFLGLKDFECHLAFYPPGAFYKKHLDRFEKDSSRSISFILYLNEEWEETDGGELVLYHQDGQVLQKILPEAGTFVCFLSADFPHEVKSSLKERRSLTGWMHTKLIN